MAAAGAGRQFTIVLKLDTHIMKANFEVLYTNDSDIVENSINTLEQLLDEDDKYKVVGFDLEYTGDHAGHDQMVAIDQLCVCQTMLIYHSFLAKRPCERFSRFLNSPDYMFATMDTTNDLKVLKTSGLSCEKHVNIQGQYMVWGSEKKKQKDSLVGLHLAIIKPYYRGMKVVCEKNKYVWHKAWVNELDE
ncbi:hypothetical protein D1007_45067 [Hordeum vulgare]|nr:hypothetical protein D1007_45067 [Hordeum vulgare]